MFRTIRTATREKKGLRWMNGERAQIIRVRLKHLNFFQSIVIIDANGHIVLYQSNEPLECSDNYLAY